MYQKPFKYDVGILLCNLQQLFKCLFLENIPQIIVSLELHFHNFKFFGMKWPII